MVGTAVPSESLRQPLLADGAGLRCATERLLITGRDVRDIAKAGRTSVRSLGGAQLRA
jgi:hypothetical protein